VKLAGIPGPSCQNARPEWPGAMTAEPAAYEVACSVPKLMEGTWADASRPYRACWCRCSRCIFVFGELFRADVGEEAEVTGARGGVSHAQPCGRGNGIGGVADDSVGAHLQRGEPAATAEDTIKPQATPGGMNGNVLLVGGSAIAADTKEVRLDASRREQAKPGHADDGALRVERKNHATTWSGVIGRRMFQVAEGCGECIDGMPYNSVEPTYREECTLVLCIK
jgi:hypothetical protein